MVARRRITIIGFATLLSLGVACCAKERGEPGWVHPDWTDKAGFWDFSEGLRVIWQSPGLRLYVDEAKVAAELAKGKKLVMVSYEDDHHDRRLVEESPHILALTANGNSRYALMGMTEQKHVDDLASRMHRHLPGFLPCGRVQRLYLTQDYNVEITTPPVLPEMIAFADVTNLVAQPAADNIAASIAALEALGTRYHNGPQGAAATTKVVELFTAAGTGIEGFTVESFDHSDVIATQQKSVVATIPGKLNTGITVVVGAHLDSINSQDNTVAPGADDDASGIAVITEMIRSIAATGATFDYNLEFHGYAAEEVGLEGSKHIAKTYAEEEKAIAAMLQLDMTAFSQQTGDTTIYFVTNNTHRNLRRSLKHLMHTYLGGDFMDGTLAGGTSDHEAWTSFGFPAVFPFENPVAYNFSLHTPQDTSATINNLQLSERFAKLGLAFISHYAGYTGASAQIEAGRATFLSSIDADLPLAITNAGGDLWNVAVSTSNIDIETVLVCRASDKASRRCGDALVEAVAGSDVAGRKIWITEEGLELKDEDRLVVFGYNAADNAVAQRTVKLTRN